jgi:hypothetical protein
MSSSEQLGAYLNDHLAGAVAAIELLDKMRSNNEDTEFGVVIDALRGDIAADRAALGEVMKALGVTPDPVKQAGGWMIEKLSRIMRGDRVTGSNDLSRLMETEALSLGIEGKLAGWRALKRLARADLGVDLDRLIERAGEQRSRLEPYRIAAATRAFA